jgi:hypothetical protein
MLFFDKLIYYKFTNIKKENINDYTDLELKNLYEKYIHNVLNKTLECKVNLHICYLNSESTTNILNNIIKTSEDGLFGKYS